MANSAFGILAKMLERAFKPSQDEFNFVRIPVNEGGDYIYDEVVVDKNDEDDDFVDFDTFSFRESVRIPKEQRGCRHDIKKASSKKRHGAQEARYKNVRRQCVRS